MSRACLPSPLSPRVSLRSTTDLSRAEKERRVARASNRSWSRFPDGNDAGEFGEGQELEGELSDGEHLGCSDHFDERLSSDDKAPPASGDVALVPVGSVELPVEAADTPEEIEEAKRLAARLELLETVDASAKIGHLPAVQFHVQREIRKLRKADAACPDGLGPRRVFQRFVREIRLDEGKMLLVLRRVNAKKHMFRLAVKLAARKARLATAKAKAKAVERKEALAKLPTEFTAAMLGQGHVSGGTRAHRVCRQDLLERLRYRSPVWRQSWMPCGRASRWRTPNGWATSTRLQLVCAFWKRCGTSWPNLGDYTQFHL